MNKQDAVDEVFDALEYSLAAGGVSPTGNSWTIAKQFGKIFMCNDQHTITIEVGIRRSPSR